MDPLVCALVADSSLLLEISSAWKVRLLSMRKISVFAACLRDFVAFSEQNHLSFVLGCRFAGQ